MERPKSYEVKNKALALYLQGKPVSDIGRILGVSANSLFRWKKKGNWEAQLIDLMEKTKDRVVEDEAERRARQMKICKATQLKYAQRLANDPDLEINYQDADRAMKHELLLCGDVTERTENKDSITREDIKKALKIKDE